ncbi:MAG: 3-isopropylmalate dehydrogenase [Oscillospiraceae bacterium]|jgi:3-isopropylmalate dehydrogenase|nr:3-isopropylmalate dehydrogenase [Oscillospiraceae bacterium]
MNKTIAVVRGDGIGPEIMAQALAVLDRVAEKFGHTFAYAEAPIGGNAVDRFGDPLPQASLEACLAADSVLLSAVGGPKWDHAPKEKRPERGLLRLRAGLGLYANLRPARLFGELRDASPLKPEIADRGINFIVVRELIGGAYFGEHSTEKLDGEYYAKDVMGYSEHEIARIARVGFETAAKRRKKLCSVDKANVLDSSKLWRKVVTEIAKEYPDVTLSHMYVDNCAMQIVRDPAQFDVIVTENLFGDILSDEASMVSGSIGVIPSSSLGDGARGLYEPIHGSAPDLAGTDQANPIGMILSAAMLLRFSFGMTEEAATIERAVEALLAEGFRTADTMSAGKTPLGCRGTGAEIRKKI